MLVISDSELRTVPGIYYYREITELEAKATASEDYLSEEVISKVGNEEDADFLTEFLGIPVKVAEDISYVHTRDNQYLCFSGMPETGYSWCLLSYSAPNVRFAVTTT